MGGGLESDAVGGKHQCEALHTGVDSRFHTIRTPHCVGLAARSAYTAARSVPLLKGNRAFGVPPETPRRALVQSRSVQHPYTAAAWALGIEGNRRA